MDIAVAGWWEVVVVVVVAPAYVFKAKLVIYRFCV